MHILRSAQRTLSLSARSILRCHNGDRLLLLAEVLCHFEMVLKRWKRLLGPILQLGILTAPGIALEQRHRILMSANLHGIEFGGEIIGLCIFQFVELALRGTIRSRGDGPAWRLPEPSSSVLRTS